MASDIGRTTENTSVLAHAFLSTEAELKVCLTIVGGTGNGCSQPTSNHAVPSVEEPVVNVLTTMKDINY